MQKKTKFELDSCGVTEAPFWEGKEYDTSETREQIEKYGFTDYELWNLDTTILEFVIPRLVRFKEITRSYPSEFEKIEDWYAVIDEIVDGLKCGLAIPMPADGQKKFRRAGLLLFKYFKDLWD